MLSIEPIYLLVENDRDALALPFITGTNPQQNNDGAGMLAAGFLKCLWATTRIPLASVMNPHDRYA